ncbi:MAG: Formate dehydrogenase O beta subunit [uncultured Propionibacteriaceae bacterium]|uniref:Formate dehydrogenase O beta subunit n=1 Tax=uncultured Propionibacteriaceae bacterium TaxID=257457 RepID=A0A6J4P8F6_9ACTN|nr:MAG: Formate dehydrogenase O beta subunit [uncultured Propionibacteriaceae bacterium]
MSPQQSGFSETNLWDNLPGTKNGFSSTDPGGPAPDAGWEAPPSRKGFFTDTSICIGCKACEVACKTWNGVPEDGLDMLGSSYDNTGALGASTWRHVAFIEQRKPLGSQDTGVTITLPEPAPPPQVDLGMPAFGLPGAPGGGDERSEFRWLMSSDVCKHCTNAACLDVCPTGSLFRTEFGTVVVQEDICNGCGYCVPACPYGVIDRRIGEQGTKNVGIAQKCTLCYDRLGVDETPACAKACPTQSIQFGDVDELRERAAKRLETLHAGGLGEARLYGEDPNNGVGGTGAFFLLLDEPEVYGFPPDPIVTTADLPRMWKNAGMAAVGLLAAAVTVFAGRRP